MSRPYATAPAHERGATIEPACDVGGIGLGIGLHPARLGGLFGGVKIRIGLQLERIDPQVILKTIIMVRKYRRLRTGRHEFSC